MHKRVRILLAGGLLVCVLLTSTGCLFNLFQTARMLGAGNVAITIGTGLMDVIPDGEATWNLTPQARIAFGLSDSLDLGFQTGALVPLSTGDFGWMGAKADLKFSVMDDPETFSLAMGIGGGYSVEFLNWGVFGEVLFNINSTLPLFLVYQPTIPLEAAEFVLWHHIAGGLRLPISETAAIILIVDYRNPLFSFGLAFEIGF
ncbi:hypothetical protein ACFLTM_02355 [Candidatus Bipolaricaulota bacterium]